MPNRKIVTGILFIVFFTLQTWTAQAQQASNKDIVMTEELMSRLIKFTRDLEGNGTVPARIGKILGLWEGTEDMKVKLAVSDDSSYGLHYFALPLETTSKDILFIYFRDTILEVYLTDKSSRLRAAAVSENGVARLLLNERVATKFEAELTLFAKEASAQLPPTKKPGKE